ncbi:MAG: RT0821/Lpp0805 family surface protein [Alphaproteobacteria bacterium]|nr:RT0821/Lpp0805 family surface protein [Alphaproteobacteria bacterium]
MMKPKRLRLAVLTWLTAALLATPALAFLDGYEGVFGTRGLKLTDDDRKIIGEAVEAALADLKLGQNKDWSNPKTGVYGSVTPLREEQYKGMRCREYMLVIKAPDNPRVHQFRIPECLVPGEGWKMAF